MTDTTKKNAPSRLSARMVSRFSSWPAVTSMAQICAGAVSIVLPVLVPSPACGRGCLSEATAGEGNLLKRPLSRRATRATLSPLRGARGKQAYSLDLNDPVLQFGLPAPEPIEVLEQQVDDIVLVLPCLARSVRRDQYVGNIPQRRGGGERLLDGAVEAGARDAALLKPLDQRRLIHNATARDIDQIRRRPHRGQSARVDQSFGLWRERTGQRDEIRLGQMLDQRRVRKHRVRRPRARSDIALGRDHAHAEGTREAREMRADAAEPDDQQRLAAELVFALAQVRNHAAPVVLHLIVA